MPRAFGNTSFDMAAPRQILYSAAPMLKTPALYEVLYVSHLAPDQPLSVVGSIASRARIHNAGQAITGLLVFDGMRFCQQLEGPKKRVLALMERICSDPRHTDVSIVYEGTLAERRFQSFSLGYSTLEDDEGLARLHTLNGNEAMAAFVDLPLEL